MADDKTARYGLPFLAVGQAQKEMTYNEALVHIDALLHPVVENIISTPPAGLSVADGGKSWLIGVAPIGEWQDLEGQIAYWTGAGWRYVDPPIGTYIWNRAFGTQIFHNIAGWSVAPAISDANGGNIVDIEARTAINAILDLLRSTGKIAP